MSFWWDSCGKGMLKARRMCHQLHQSSEKNSLLQYLVIEAVANPIYHWHVSGLDTVRLDHRS